MSRVEFYGTDTAGYIAVTGVCEEADLPLQSMPGVTYVVGDGTEDATTQYVLEGAITPRPPCPITVAIAGRVVSLTGVPSGAAYSVSGDASLSGVADASGELDFTFGAAGTYQIAVACFPCLDFAHGVTLL